MKAKIVKTAALVLAAAAALCALFAAVTYLALFRPNFMRRTKPYSQKETLKHFVTAENAARAAADEAWFAAADRVRLEAVSRDGLTLVAYYLPHEGAKGIVLMMHGFQSAPMRDFASIARFYYESGYSICLPYQRAHGESEGRYITYGIQERHDVRTWIDELNERYGLENDIYVHGISMGCATVLMASAERAAQGNDGYAYPFNVRGVIADCGFTSPWEIICYVLNARLYRLTHPTPRQSRSPVVITNAANGDGSDGESAAATASGEDATASDSADVSGAVVAATSSAAAIAADVSGSVVAATSGADVSGADATGSADASVAAAASGDGVTATVAAPSSAAPAVVSLVPPVRSYLLAALLTRVGDFYARKCAGFSLTDYSTLAALSVNETPVLFIHGTDDDFVPPFMTLANYEACHAPKELLLVNGARHAMSFYTDEARYRQAVTAFLERNALPR